MSDPGDAKELLSRLARAAQREVETISMAMRDRGAKRFGRILALGLAAVLVSYMGVYVPAKKKLAGLDKRISMAKSAARYADRYKEASQRLDRLRSALPPANQADSWALERVRQTLNARDIAPDSISVPENRPANGYIEQSVRFSMSAKFPEVVAWLNDLEFGKGVLQVTSLDIAKQGAELGVNRVTCTVETLIPGPGLTP